MPPLVEKVGKVDANSEAFQMRAQWKKVEMCRLLWHEKWSWLLEEKKKALDEADALRQAANLRQVHVKHDFGKKTLKPTPVTTNGFYGWIAGKPDCQLEIYTSWLSKPPLRAPDAWDDPNYFTKAK